MQLTQWIQDSAARFDSRSRLLGWGRTVIAGAELSVLLASTNNTLFFSGPILSENASCTGLRTAGLWCITGVDGAGSQAGRLLAVGVLVAVAVGFSPRWTCIPHWYVAFSMATRITALDGGEQVAEIATMLLIPICWGDRRTWQWQTPDGQLPATWRGSSFAAWLLLRLQVCVIYTDAALSKLRFPSWRDGNALPTILDGPQFGLPGYLRGLLDPLLVHAWIGRTMTWSVLALELCLAASMLAATRVRRALLVPGICLHLSIIICMGLVSFGLIMIGTLMLTCLRTPGAGSAFGIRLRPVHREDQLAELSAR